MRIRQAVEAAGDATSLTGRRSVSTQPSADGAAQSIEQLQSPRIVFDFLVQRPIGNLDGPGRAKWHTRFGLCGPPVPIRPVTPPGDRRAAVFLDDGFVASAAEPDERIRVAGFEEVLGNFAVGLLGEEPFGDGAVPPPVAQFAVDLQADVFGQRGDVIFLPGYLRFHDEPMGLSGF